MRPVCYPSRTGAAMLLLPLAGCMSMSGLDSSSKYACAAPKGVACNSVSGNYANAIRGNLPSQQRAFGAAAAKAPGDASGPPSKASSRESSRTPPAPATDTPQPLALRSQARYLRLWIKPWEDIDGDLLDQSYVYVQIDHGRWQIEHVRQAIFERYAPLQAPPAASAAATTETSADPPAPPPVQRPSGTSGFPLLGNPASNAGSHPAGSDS